MRPDLLAAARRLEALAGGALVLAEEADGSGGNPLARDALGPLLEILRGHAAELADLLEESS
jgi:hypothetical protein